MKSTLTMELKLSMEKEIIECLDLEVELLQGTREELPNNRVRIICEINDRAKYEVVFKFLVGFIANCEQKINPN